MQRSLIVTGVVLVVAVVALVAQQAIQEQHRDANPKACMATASDSPATKPASPYVNVKCPIMKGDIDPAKVTDATTREFNGQKVAFCCGGCPAQWDKLSDKEKQAKLDAVKTPATQPAQKTGGGGCGCCQ